VPAFSCLCQVLLTRWGRDPLPRLLIARIACAH
jgi:hypothetical protein